MNRRSFISAVGTASVVGLAGCSMPGDPSASPDQDADDTSDTNDEPSDDSDESAPLTITDHSFEITKPLDAPDEPTITKIDGNTVTVEGTAKVNNSCKSIQYASDPAMGDTNPLTVNLSIESYKAEDEVCLETIETLGFVAEFTYEGETPEEISVKISAVNDMTATLSVEEFMNDN